MLLQDAIDEFFIEQRVRGNSAVTLRDYKTKLNMFLKFVGNVDVSELNLHVCRSYYLHIAEKQENTVTVQTYIRSLRAFLNFLYNNEFIDVDICKKFKLPKARQMMIDILTDDELEAIFKVYPGDDFYDVRNRAILSLMLDSGLRLNEVVTADRRKLHLKERFIIVTGKGNKQRAAAFGLTTQNTLKRYLELAPESDRLIIKVSTHGTAEPIKITTIKQLFRTLKNKSGIKRVHSHLLRHTFATRYLENGGNIFTLQLLLGHTSLDMVKKYLHLAQTRVRKEFVNYSPLDRYIDELQEQKKPPHK
ncbi:MAG: tyrosine-type recombinase/integrase [Clostridia bacterium]|nr:tyrosine-type recombinase/integrase [Clostridia bacterium]